MEKILHYFSSSWHELKLVTWPTKKELYELTLLVIGISIAVGALVGILDFIFQYGLTLLIGLKK